MVAEKFGNTLEKLAVGKTCIDNENKIITTPAYMKSTAKPDEIYQGIENMIQDTLKQIKL